MSHSLRLLSSSSLRAISRTTPTSATSRKCLIHSTSCLQARMSLYNKRLATAPSRSAHSSAALKTARQEQRQEEDVLREDADEERDGDDIVGAAYEETTQELTEHLNGLFPPLKFPPELARRILTHASHPAAVNGHNASLTFMGRRVLESYLLLFLSSSKAVQPSHDFEAFVSKTINTYILGEHVGSKWGLGRVLRWTPTMSSDSLENVKNPQQKHVMLKKVGLYKVQGDAVAAVVGGVFQQFGASCAHRLFHTRVLPYLCLSQNRNMDAFHQDANQICQKMGGPDGSLLLSDVSSTTTPEPAAQSSTVLEATRAHDVFTTGHAHYRPQQMTNQNFAAAEPALRLAVA